MKKAVLDLALLGIILLCVYIGVMWVLGPDTQERPLVLPPCLHGLSISPTEDARVAQCLTAQPTATPLPWWKFSILRTPTPLPRATQVFRCTRWDKIDSSYLGERYLCVTGIVQAIGASGTDVFFSTNPQSFYVLSEADALAELHPGDCIQAMGTVSRDAGQTLYLDASYHNIRFCP